MNKKNATIKARQGVTAGDLRAILNVVAYPSDSPSKVNKAFTKSQVWRIMHSAIAYCATDIIVDESIATNILREFAPDEPQVKTAINAGGIPF